MTEYELITGLIGGTMMAMFCLFPVGLVLILAGVGNKGLSNAVLVIFAICLALTVGAAALGVGGY